MATTAEGFAVTCNFTSISQVLASTTDPNANLTDLVKPCGNICSLAWGAGNPDLSGVGANLSYIIQAVLGFLVGPVMLIIWGFCRHRKVAYLTEIEQTFENIRNSFMDVNSQFCISVILAASIRIGNDSTSFFESSFLESLIAMHTITMWTSYFSTVCFTSKLTNATRLELTHLYSFVYSILLLPFISRQGLPAARWKVLEQLIQHCEEYGPVKPGFYDREHLSSWGVGIGIGLGIGFGVPFGGLLFTILARQRVLTPMFDRLYPLYHLLVEEPFGGALINIGIYGGIGVLLVEVEKKRDTIRKLAGQLFEDDEWGFGQVIAVLFWIPFMVQAIFTIVKCTILVRGIPRHRQEDQMSLEARHAISISLDAYV